MNASRRHFLKAAGGLAAAAGSPAAQRFSAPLAMTLSGMAALASQSSAAADTSGYKAIVCLYMVGGNDSHNWVVPIDATGYAEYAAARAELALSQDRLQPIASTTQDAGRTFAMPQYLSPLRDWYQSGNAAIVANVGPLIRPTTKSDYQNSTSLPAKLFSHNDQASAWQSLSPEGATSGWGGRMADILKSANQYPVFTTVSANSNAVFLAGSTVTQYQLGTEGPVSVRALDATSVFYSSGAPSGLRNAILASGATPFQAEYARVVQRSLDANGVLQTALKSVKVPAIPTTSIQLGTGATITLDQDSLAKQFRVVAQMIAAGQALGMKRQVFMVSMNGFDTHANQMRDHPSLMARVAHASNYFLSAMSSMGLLNNVVLFSASDFGRTLTSNGSGSDHGWGSHHFVAGGGIKGGNIYGRFPVTALGTQDDVGSGRLLPSTSVTQLAATLGTWMGLSATELNTVLPNLTNFSQKQLNFI